MLPKTVQSYMIVYHSLENIDMKYIALFSKNFLLLLLFNYFYPKITFTDGCS